MEQSLLESLLENPIRFLTNLYRYEEDRLTSPYLPINGELCSISSLDQVKLVKVSSVFVHLTSADLSFNQRSGKCYPSNYTQRIGSDLFTHELLSSLLLHQYSSGVLTYRLATLCGEPIPESFPSFPHYIPIWTGTESAMGGTPSFGYIQVSRSFQRSANPHRGLVGLLFYKDNVISTLEQLGDNPSPSEKMEFDQSLYSVLNRHTLLDIVRSLLETLNELQRSVSFQHGHLMCRSVYWVENQGWQIGDLERSLFLISIKGTPYLFYPHIEDVYGPRPLNFYLDWYTDEPYYQIETISPSEAHFRGLPFFNSFDTYTLLISLVLIPAFGIPILSDSRLRRCLWEPLWFLPDLHVMENRVISTYRQELSKQNFDKILSLLRGVRLKCRITEHLLNAIFREFA